MVYTEPNAQVNILLLLSVLRSIYGHFQAINIHMDSANKTYPMKDADGLVVICFDMVVP